MSQDKDTPREALSMSMFATKADYDEARLKQRFETDQRFKAVVDAIYKEWTRPGRGRHLSAHRIAEIALAAIADVPAVLPESLSRDETLKYYSDYANMQSAEALRYQKRIRDLEAALASPPPQPTEGPQKVRCTCWGMPGTNNCKVHSV